MAVASIRIFADGAIESPAHTASLPPPYLDPATGRPGASRSALLFDPAIIGAMFAEANRQGFDIHTHAVGDGAVHATLDACEAQRRSAGPELCMLSIAHLELIDPGEDAVMYRRGAPSLALSRGQPAGGQRAAVGRHDWSVSAADPMVAIRLAVLRTNPFAPGAHRFEGCVFAVLQEADRLSVKVVVDACTIGSAREVPMVGTVCSIAVCKRADLIVLDFDVFAVATKAPDDPLGGPPASGCD